MDIPFGFSGKADGPCIDIAFNDTCIPYNYTVSFFYSTLYRTVDSYSSLSLNYTVNLCVPAYKSFDFSERTFIFA